MTFRHSSRSRPWNDSTCPFFHRFFGTDAVERHAPTIGPVLERSRGELGADNTRIRVIRHAWLPVTRQRGSVREYLWVTRSDG
jgi:hypothetical protein